jgi:DNA-binding CsgD family transcriptional regulator
MPTQMTITNRDIARLMAIADPARRAECGDSFPESILHDLRALIPCVCVDYLALDPYREWILYDSCATTDAPDPEGDDPTCAERAHLFWRYFWAWGNSLAVRTGNHTLVFAGLPPMIPAAADAWAEMARMTGITCELNISLPPRGQMTTQILIARDGRAGFTEREQRLMQLIQPHLAELRRAVNDHSVASPLTPRQQQILRLVAGGLTNRQIARRMQIAEGTVRKHLENSYAALGVNNRLDAVARST